LAVVWLRVVSFGVLPGRGPAPNLALPPCTVGAGGGNIVVQRS